LQQAKRPDQIQSHETDKGQKSSMPNVPGKTEAMINIEAELAKYPPYYSFSHTEIIDLVNRVRNDTLKEIEDFEEWIVFNGFKKFGAAWALRYNGHPFTIQQLYEMYKKEQDENNLQTSGIAPEEQDKPV
jgi:hypothetical protein